MKREPQSARPSTRSAEGRGPARLIGTLAHRVLEHWDYADDPAGLAERIAAVCHSGLPPEQAREAAEVEAELRELFATFLASKPYERLRRATIVGREVPFTIPWPVSETRHPSPVTRHYIMEGVIDLVYRLGGQVWAADYKTDRVRDEEVGNRAAEYHLQAKIYKEAVSRCLGVDKVGFQFLFLRNGVAVTV
jgi:ATP-dependent helicase/nuclease subunit A